MLHRTKLTRQDMGNYSHLPPAHVRTSQAVDYISLLDEVCS
jgi:hypothetical protein